MCSSGTATTTKVTPQARANPLGQNYPPRDRHPRNPNLDSERNPFEIVCN